MKEQHWDDSIEEAPKDILEASTVLLDDGDDEALEKSTVSSNKLRVTEMRRRIEERLDSKRISLEFDYEESDDWADILQ
jgi:hypothetical protein